MFDVHWQASNWLEISKIKKFFSYYFERFKGANSLKKSSQDFNFFLLFQQFTSFSNNVQLHVQQGGKFCIYLSL